MAQACVLPGADMGRKSEDEGGAGDDAGSGAAGGKAVCGGAAAGADLPALRFPAPVVLPIAQVGIPFVRAMLAWKEVRSAREHVDLAEHACADRGALLKPYF